MSLPPYIKAICDSRWVAVGLSAALVILLTLVAIDVRHGMPHLPPLSAGTNQLAQIVPVSQAAKIFAPGELTQVCLAKNGNHAFFTKHFEPPPPPPPAPEPPKPVVPVPPPPPPTKKIPVLYQGSVETSDGKKKVFVTVETNLVILVSGARLAGEWGIADISLRTLTLTNASAQTNILPFNSAKELEIPLK